MKTLLLLTLQAIQSEHPAEWRYARDLADAWFQQGKIVQADSLLIEFDEEPSTDFWLLKAKINFQQQSDAAGQAGYERALALVQTQADAQLILGDLLYLISDAYSVWPYSKDTEIENPRKKKPIIRTGTRQNGEKRDEKVWMSFDFSEQKKGKYVIEILVEDQVGGAEVRKLVPVEVEWGLIRNSVFVIQYSKFKKAEFRMSKEKQTEFRMILGLYNAFSCRHSF